MNAPRIPACASVVLAFLFCSCGGPPRARDDGDSRTASVLAGIPGTRERPCQRSPDSLFDHAAESLPDGAQWRREYGEDSVLIEETAVVRGPDGEWVEHGPWRLWYDNGRRCAVGFHDMGQREGCSFSWFRTGGLEVSAYYQADKSHAMVTWYYENGLPSLMEEYVDGVKQGEYVRWYDTGKMMEEARHRDGIPDGPYAKYYRDGSLKEQGRFVDGKRLVERVFAPPPGSLE